jgi:cardiolipin synthase A/B
MMTAITTTGFLPGAVVAVFVVAVVGIVVALLTDDRDPTTVIAWLLVVTLVPFLGVILYFFIGRNYRRETPLRQRVMGEIEAEAAHVLAPVYETHAAFTAEAKASLAGTSAHKLAEMNERAGGTPILPAGSVEVFTSGAEKFPALLADIGRARHHVHLMYLIWERDELTAQVTEILLAKLKQGVEVRILYDFVTCLFYRKDELRLLAASGASVKPCFRRLGQINYRNHMKIALIDGEVVYTGGMNMGQEYIDGGRRFACWRDTHLRLTGPIIAPFAILFAALWRLNGAHEDIIGGYLPEPRPGSNGTAVPVQVLHSSVATPFKSIRDACIVALLEARESVWIQTPYFIPDEPLLNAMRMAALAGTDVRLMTVGVPDKKLVLWAAHPYYRQVLESGVRVFQYTAGFLHAKTVTVDGRWCVIGTCNWDIRSMILHEEVSCVFYEEGLARRQESIFRDDLESCREFTLGDWHAQSRGEHLRDSFMRLFSRLL